MSEDIINLAQISNKPIAEEIKRLLEEMGIYSLLSSSNPASAINNIYLGPTATDEIIINVNQSDYNNAVQILKDNGYSDLLI